jgi:DNA integrity scanning protein DisA with diadenylate cyclase activity
VLGPTGRDHLDTVTLHDLAQSWSEEFPFDVQPLIESGFIHTIMAVLDIALDIGALGREGKAVGTIFVIGDSEVVLGHSHQAVFNPFHGYPREERSITRAEVVESLKELARLDGAIIITADGFVEAAGRNLDQGSRQLENFHGLGARHRAAAGISVGTNAVSVVVSESTGKVTIFRQGRTVATMEPLISRRLV